MGGRDGFSTKTEIRRRCLQMAVFSSFAPSQGEGEAPELAEYTFCGIGQIILLGSFVSVSCQQPNLQDWLSTNFVNLCSRHLAGNNFSSEKFSLIKIKS